MDAPETDRLERLEAENARLRSLLADIIPEVRTPSVSDDLPAPGTATLLPRRGEGEAATFAELVERTSFVSDILRGSADCIKVHDLDGNLLFMSDGGRRATQVNDFVLVSGCYWPDFWQLEGHPAARAALEIAKGGGVGRFQDCLRNARGQRQHWDVQITPIRNSAGVVDRLLSISRDITEMKRSEEEARMLASIVEQTDDFIAIASPEGEIRYLNDAGRRLLGLPDGEALRGLRMIELFAGDDQPAVADTALPAARDGHSWQGEMRLRHHETGASVPVLFNLFPLRDEDGEVTGYGTVTKDLTEHKKVEERQRLLAQELAHRMKNTLAMVQAIATQSLRQARTVEEGRDALGSRIAALSKAQDILTRTSWSHADIGGVVDGALEPHWGEGGRFRVTGPPVELTAPQALGLSLALHELATNAAKYGALSGTAGRVDIGWSNHPADGFSFTWRESGGPPVEAPERRGFGSRMIERTVGDYFNGTATVDYAPTGLVFSLRAPADALAGA